MLYKWGAHAGFHLPVSTSPIRQPFPVRLNEQPAVARMAMTDLLSAADIKAAIAAFAAPDSFNYKKFFAMVGLKKKNPEEVRKCFHILDRDQSGFIEEDELNLLMKNFSPEGRDLTAKETKAMIASGDKDGDGKIGVEEFVSMVAES